MTTYCLGCQNWTESLNPQIHVCSNQRLRESSTCKQCGANKSVFLREDIWKACILAQRSNVTRHAVPNCHQQPRQQNVPIRGYQEQRQESDNAISVERQIFMVKDREFQDRLEKTIRHQWNIDHVPNYYEDYKAGKQKALLQVNVF